MTETNSTAAPSVRASQVRKSEVGELRPSQLLFSFGIGSLVDLPSLSVLILLKAEKSFNDAGISIPIWLEKSVA